MKQNWYQKTIEQVFIDLLSQSSGLNGAEVEERLHRYGLNQLPEVALPSRWRLFWKQFTSPLVYILLLVSVVVMLLGDFTDASVILFILLFNAIIGMVQEGRAQDTLAALKRFVKTKALVKRDGQEVLVFDYDLVPGDVVVLHEGDRVPADGRLIESVGVTVDEASLTGESMPIIKVIEPLEKEMGLPTLSPADQLNMVFRGTHLVSGSGIMVVTTTGINTEIGRLSQSVALQDTEIPLQKNIRYLSRVILVAVSVMCGSLFVIGLLVGKSPVEMMVVVVSLAVSIIPEGLPVVMTMILANGVWRMGQRKALVKKLGAVEALGQTNIIAVDKTGTITKNELIVRKVLVGGKVFDISGNGWDPNGSVSLHKQLVSPAEVPELILAGKLAMFSKAELIYDPEQKLWIVSGDPTEAAILVLGEKLGFKQNDILSKYKIIQELPFDYKKHYRAVVFTEQNEATLFVSGSPEALFKLSGQDPVDYQNQLAELASAGLRLIAFGFVKVSGLIDPNNLPKLVFGGIFGMQDTLHDEVPGAVADVQSAGMKVVMITGDWPDTAKAIAKTAGIYREGDTLLTGVDIVNLSEAQLMTALQTTTVFARVTPEHKLQIIQAYRKMGQVIAMTGDGVNDVPSLVAADLGVGMGKSGTEVAKEAADIVLLDDNFTTIAAAVEEGRNIYRTIKRALLYLFSTSLGELFVVAGALVLAWPLPVTAVQILWLNFVTDGFLTISFAMEPKEGNLLRQPFRKPTKYIIDKVVISRMIPMGLVMAFGTLWLFSFYKDGDLIKAQTMAVTVLAVYQWFNAYNSRSETRSIFTSLFRNKWLIGATVLVVLLQIGAVHWSVFQKFLGTVALSFQEWLIVLAIAISVILLEEIRKLTIFLFFKPKVK